MARSRDRARDGDANVVYSATAGLVALLIFWLQIRKGLTNGPWAFLLVACSFIIGSAPLISSILPGLLNWLVNLVSNFVFHQSVETGGVYSGAVVILSVVLLVWFLRDGRISNSEKWGLVIAAFVVGSTPLVTSWFPGFLNELFSMIPV